MRKAVGLILCFLLLVPVTSFAGDLIAKDTGSKDGKDSASPAKGINAIINSIKNPMMRLIG